MVKNNKEKQISAREMIRHYKDIMAEVDKTQAPIIIKTGDLQIALISMGDLKIIQDIKYKNSAKNLLNFANQARELLKDEHLPSDLSINHDRYFLEDD